MSLLATRRQRTHRPKALWANLAAAALTWSLPEGRSAPAFTDLAPGVAFGSEVVAKVPWAIHVVRVDRAAGYALKSIHAQNAALGLVSLSKQLAALPAGFGQPLAALNGDFYQRDRRYAGDPRGLQILNGELISAPVGGPCLWIDGAGQPHLDTVASKATVTWPGGVTTPIGLNQDRKAGKAVLYTAALGATTGTTGGREFLLQPTPPLGRFSLDTKWPAKITAVNEAGNSPLPSGNVVLSIAPELAASLPLPPPDATVQINLGSSPELPGAVEAVSGGPILLHKGKRQKIDPGENESYVATSMVERHPRSAVAWNDRYYYLVEVDGRQRASAGMTLDELEKYLIGLDCLEALNLDGGGSATLWAGGSVRNHPCDGYERPIANAIVVVAKGP